MELVDDIFKTLKEISNRSDLSRKQRAVLKRKTLVTELHKIFAEKFKETRDVTATIEYMEKCHRLMIRSKPQDRSFYEACAFEFQREFLESLKKVKERQNKTSRVMW